MSSAPVRSRQVYHYTPTGESAGLPARGFPSAAARPVSSIRPTAEEEPAASAARLWGSRILREELCRASGVWAAGSSGELAAGVAQSWAAACSEQHPKLRAPPGGPRLHQSRRSWWKHREGFHAVLLSAPVRDSGGLSTVVKENVATLRMRGVA